MDRDPRKATILSWQRFIKHYQTAAVLLLNTLLLVAVVLAIFHFVFPLEDSIWNQNLDGRRMSEDFVPGHYYFSDGEETEAIRQALDAYILQGHWQVHPWTGLINREYSSQHLNIDAEGGRAGRPPSLLHREGEPLTLWSFGGSTLFGWGLADGDTIPSQLQVELQRLLPHRHVRVSNFGVPWYNSSHELALLVANLRRQPPPDAVVFLDGLNDLVHRLHYQTESPLHHQLERAWEDRLDDLFAPPPWLHLTDSFPLFRAAQSARRPSTTTLGGISGSQTEDDANVLTRQAAEGYSANRRTASAVCEQWGITPTFFLQPVPMWLNDARDASTDPKYNTFADLVLEQGDHNLHDLRSSLARLDQSFAMTVEEVGVHYSDAASQVLAKAMAEIIASAEPSERGL